MALLRLVFRYNVRSLRTRGTDAISTLLGIALTAAVLVVVLALAHGLDKAFATSGRETVSLVMGKGSPSESQSIIDFEPARTLETLDGIEKRADGSPIVSPETVVLMNLPRRDSTLAANVVFRGVRKDAFDVRPELKIVAGRMFTEGLEEVIVGHRIADRFQDCGKDETITAGKYHFKVVGIYECPGADESEIWGDERLIQKAFLRPVYSSIRVKFAGPSDKAFTDALAKEEARLPFMEVIEKKYYADQQELASTPIKIVAWVLAVCMAIGSSLGAMNTMYARVAARSKEIGTLRAIGFGRSTIVASFVFESIALAVTGGAIGCLIALPIHGLSTGTSNWQTFSEIAFAFTVGPRSIIPALVLSGIVGLIGGFMPSLQAATMPIPSALREV
jgi:ABC-type lipoprotein release transport system permease subunit